MAGNTAPFDVTGHPGLSAPCAMLQGLPVGLMLIGRYFDEPTLLRIGHAYEQAVDWRKAYRGADSPQHMRSTTLSTIDVPRSNGSRRIDSSGWCA